MSSKERDRLDGRRALVTGGSKGTGKAVGALDVLVHVVGGASTPAGGFAVITEEQWLTHDPHQGLPHTPVDSPPSPGRTQTHLASLKPRTCGEFKDRLA